MNTAAKLVSVAKNEIGYLEKKSASQLDSKTANAGSANYTKYGAWFNWNGVYWCHQFVSWCAYAADCADIIPKTASCSEGVSYFQKRGQFFLRGTLSPKAGDIIYFSSSTYPNGGAHVGIVTDYKNGTVYTVEGNTSGASGVISNGGGVCAKQYAANNARIYGYGRPAYLTKEDDEVVEKKTIKIDGKDYTCDVIKKDGYNYIQLADLAQAGFGVTYDSNTKTPGIVSPMTRTEIDGSDDETHAAIDIVQISAKLEEKTMEYLLRYRYGDDLVKKLAEAMN